MRLSIVAGIILGAVLFVTPGLAQTACLPTLPCLPPAGPDVIIAGETKSYSNGTFLVLGDIDVQSGGTLALDNATFIFAGGPWTLHVEAGGTIITNASTMTADTVGSLVFALTSIHFRVQIDPGANYEMGHSTFSSGRAVVISSDNGRVENDTFLNDDVGLTLDHVNVTVANDSFVNNSVGIDAEGGAPTIQHTTIDGGQTCILANDSDIMVAESQLHHCLTGVSQTQGSSDMRLNLIDDGENPLGHGLSLTNANAVVSFNEISRWGTAILARNSDLVLSNNTFEDDGTAVDSQKDNDSSPDTIENNSYSDGATGLILVNEDTLVRNNSFTNQSIVAITIAGGSPVIDANTILDSTTCLADVATNVTVTHNTMTSCIYGVNETNSNSVMRFNSLTDGENPLGHGVMVTADTIQFDHNTVSRFEICFLAIASSVTMSDNTFTDCDTGISSSDGPITIQQTSLATSIPTAGLGIAVEGSPLTLTNTTIRGFATAILTNTSDATIRSNTIRDAAECLDGSAGQLTIAQNDLASCGGAHLSGLTASTFTGNALSTNGASGSALSVDASAIEISANTIVAASDQNGITITGSTANVTDNTLTGDAQNVTAGTATLAISTDGSSGAISRNTIGSFVIGVGVTAPHATPFLVDNDTMQVVAIGIDAPSIALNARDDTIALAGDATRGASTGTPVIGVLASAATIDAERLTITGADVGIDASGGALTASGNTIGGNAASALATVGIQTGNAPSMTSRGNTITSFRTGISGRGIASTNDIITGDPAARGSGTMGVTGFGATVVNATIAHVDTGATGADISVTWSRLDDVSDGVAGSGMITASSDTMTNVTRTGVISSCLPSCQTLSAYNDDISAAASAASVTGISAPGDILYAVGDRITGAAIAIQQDGDIAGASFHVLNDTIVGRADAAASGRTIGIDVSRGSRFSQDPSAASEIDGNDVSNVAVAIQAQNSTFRASANTIHSLDLRGFDVRSSRARIDNGSIAMLADPRGDVAISLASSTSDVKDESIARATGCVTITGGSAQIARDTLTLCGDGGGISALNATGNITDDTLGGDAQHAAIESVGILSNASSFTIARNTVNGFVIGVGSVASAGDVIDSNTVTGSGKAFLVQDGSATLTADAVPSGASDPLEPTSTGIWIQNATASVNVATIARVTNGIAATLGSNATISDSLLQHCTSSCVNVSRSAKATLWRNTLNDSNELVVVQSDAGFVATHGDAMTNASFSAIETAGDQRSFDGDTLSYSSHGLHATSSTNVTISNATFSRDTIAAQLFGSHIAIRDSHVDNDTDGLLVGQGDAFDIARNVVRDSGSGIWAFQATNVTATRDDINATRGILFDASGGDLENDTPHGSQYAANLQGGSITVANDTFDSPGYALEIYSALSGARITHSTFTSAGGQALFVQSSANAIIANDTFGGGAAIAVNLSGASNAQVVDNTVSASSQGIAAFYATANIARNVVTGPAEWNDTIHAGVNADEATIQDNTISSWTYGIDLSVISSASRNTVTNARDGIVGQTTHDIIGNTVTGGAGALEGISVSLDHSKIKDNVVSGWQYGIHASGVAVTIDGDTSSFNAQGIVVENATGASVVKNSEIDNTTVFAVRIEGGTVNVTSNVVRASADGILLDQATSDVGSNNVAGLSGTGIRAINATPTIHDNMIDAMATGVTTSASNATMSRDRIFFGAAGVVDLGGSTLSIANATISDLSDGGVGIRGGSSIVDSTFYNVSAHVIGGRDGPITIARTTVSISQGQGVGLQLENANGSVISNFTMDGGLAGIYVGNTTGVTLVDVETNGMDQDGIHLVGSTMLNATRVTASYNSGDGFNIEGGYARIDASSIVGNTGYGIDGHGASVSTINATDTYWGSADGAAGSDNSGSGSAVSNGVTTVPYRTYSSGYSFGDMFGTQSGPTTYTNWIDITGHTVLRPACMTSVYPNLDCTHGGFVDLKNGSLVSKQLFSLDGGPVVGFHLSFDLGGAAAGTSNKVTVRIGSVYNETFTLSPSAPWTHYTRNFGPFNYDPGYAQIEFDADPTSGGPVLDNVGFYEN